MNLAEELRSAGVLPTGPVSAWPKERNDLLTKQETPQHATKVKATPMQMAQGLVRTAGAALANGRVTEEVRNKRYDVCKACPAFIEDSKRCSECGCFMEAKTWVNADAKILCPLNKWES